MSTVDSATLLIDGPWEHRFVAANGARFHVALAGPDERDAPLVVLLHGVPEFWWAWRHQLPALADAGYRVAAMDVRGTGGSDKPPVGYDVPTLAADVAGVIQSLGAVERRGRRQRDRRRDRLGHGRAAPAAHPRGRRPRRAAPARHPRQPARRDPTRRRQAARLHPAAVVPRARAHRGRPGRRGCCTSGAAARAGSAPTTRRSTAPRRRCRSPRTARWSSCAGSCARCRAWTVGATTRPCEPRRPLPVLQIHGGRDGIRPAAHAALSEPDRGARRAAATGSSCSPRRATSCPRRRPTRSPSCCSAGSARSPRSASPERSASRVLAVPPTRHPLSIAAALIGSSSPIPADGHDDAIGHAPHAGLRAKQVRRPWKISRCDAMVQSARGSSAVQLLLHHQRVVARGVAEPLREPHDVRVRGDAGDAERVAEHHVGGLATHPRQRHQVLEPWPGTSPPNRSTSAADSPMTDLVLARKKPVGSQDLLDLLRVRGGQRRRVRVAGEEGRRREVHPHVRRLRRQHRGDEQLERRREVELAVRVRVPHGERPVDPPGTTRAGEVRLRGRARGRVVEVTVAAYDRAPTRAAGRAQRDADSPV